MTVTTSTGGITIPNNTIIVSITNNTAVLSNNVTGNGQATITAIGPSDGAAEDGGLIVKGTTDKSILWKGTDSGVTYNTWVSSENFDLAANKKLTLNGICVADPVGQTIGPVNGGGTDDINLSGGGTPYALGSAVTGASLTSVGTLTSLAVSGTAELGSLSAGPGIVEESYHNDTGGGIQGNYNHDVLTYGEVFYGVTNAVANFTFNVRGNGTTTYNSITDINKVSTVTVYVTANSKYLTEFRIDNTAQTVKWADGSAPSSGSASGVDVYAFTIMKTAASTYHVFGNVTNFG